MVAVSRPAVATRLPVTLDPRSSHDHDAHPRWLLQLRQRQIRSRRGTQGSHRMPLHPVSQAVRSLFRVSEPAEVSSLDIG